MDANQRCDQNIDVAGFDLLDCADVEVCQFRQPLLSDFSGCPLPTDIRSDLLQLTRKRTAKWHAPLGRVNLLEWNGALGRNRLMNGPVLENTVQELNRQILGMGKTVMPGLGETRSAFGVVKGKPFRSDVLKGHLPVRHVPVKGNKTKSFPLALPVVARIDRWSETHPDDLPVIIAVGINYGSATLANRATAAIGNHAD